MNYRYEVDSNNAVRIYVNDSQVPMLFQPTWPNQTPWASSEEASQWAELYIAAATVADAPYAPAGPNIAAVPKPTPEQIAERKANIEARRFPTNPGAPTA